MNRPLVSGLFATVAASAVLACSLIALPPPIAPVEIGVDDILEHGTGAAIMVVGQALQNMYGDNFNSSQVHVNSVPVRFFSASYI